MNKLSKFEVTIDVTSPKQVEALSTFLTAIGEDIVENTEVNGAETVTTSPVAKKRQPAAAKPKLDVVKDDAQPEETVEDENEAPAAEHDIKIEDVRSLLSKTVNGNEDNRQKCKDKLTELGASNVSSLDAAKYPVFFEHMKSL